MTSYQIATFQLHFKIQNCQNSHGIDLRKDENVISLKIVLFKFLCQKLELNFMNTCAMYMHTYPSLLLSFFSLSSFLFLFLFLFLIFLCVSISLALSDLSHRFLFCLYFYLSVYGSPNPSCFNVFYLLFFLFSSHVIL